MKYVWLGPIEKSIFPGKWIVVVNTYDNCVGKPYYFDDRELAWWFSAGFMDAQTEELEGRESASKLREASERT